MVAAWDEKRPEVCGVIFETGNRASSHAAAGGTAPRYVAIHSCDNRDVVNPLGNLDRAMRGISSRTAVRSVRTATTCATPCDDASNVAIEPQIIEAPFSHISIHSQLAATYDVVRHRPQVPDAPRSLTDRLNVLTEGGAEAHKINISRDSDLHTE